WETFNYLDPIPGPACYPGNGFCGPLVQRNQPATASETWTVNPQLVNEFRFSFLRNSTATNQPSYGKGLPGQLGLKNIPPPDTFPFLSVSGAIPTALGPGNGILLFQTVFAPSDTISWVKGRHILKIGGEFQKIRLNPSLGLQSGTFAFTGLFTGQPPA